MCKASGSGRPCLQVLLSLGSSPGHPYEQKAKSSLSQVYSQVSPRFQLMQSAIVSPERALTSITTLVINGNLSRSLGMEKDGEMRVFTGKPGFKAMRTGDSEPPQATLGHRQQMQTIKSKMEGKGCKSKGRGNCIESRWVRRIAPSEGLLRSAGGTATQGDTELRVTPERLPQEYSAFAQVQAATALQFLESRPPRFPDKFLHLVLDSDCRIFQGFSLCHETYLVIPLMGITEKKEEWHSEYILSHPCESVTTGRTPLRELPYTSPEWTLMSRDRQRERKAEKGRTKYRPLSSCNDEDHANLLTSTDRGSGFFLWFYTRLSVTALSQLFCYVVRMSSVFVVAHQELPSYFREQLFSWHTGGINDPSLEPSIIQTARFQTMAFKLVPLDTYGCDAGSKREMTDSPYQ
ncbi:predicted protein [Histoplasma capsulatum H143]|uniref:Uncharacterized protein n=1 Tax=Ajellomyces capsulatus (strain H143) TaxID=544712 RepID=C6HL19_AJECH|nr:predicted protein [Histoplasma capsulatum H143]